MCTPQKKEKKRGKKEEEEDGNIRPGHRIIHPADRPNETLTTVRSVLPYFCVLLCPALVVFSCVRKSLFYHLDHKIINSFRARERVAPTTLWAFFFLFSLPPSYL